MVRADTSELVVTVPAGATTGAVSVTTSAGTAVGATLTIAPSRLPTVTAVSPTSVAPGASITVTGTDFSTAPGASWVAINNTRAVVTAVTPTSLTATVPDHVSSGRLTVGTPRGRGSSAFDVTVAPAPITTGDIETTGRVVAGTKTAVPVATPGKVAVRFFDGAAGQRMTLSTSGTTFAYSYLSVLRPDGTPIVDRRGSSTNQFIDTFPIQDSGTYTVIIDPDTTATGTTEVLLRTVAPDVSGAITVGGAAVTVPITTPGQNAGLTFTGTAGQRIALTATNTSITDYEDFAIVSPAGATLYASYLTAGNTTAVWSDIVTLPAAGTYTIRIDPEKAGVGSASYSLKGVPADVSATIAVDGPAVPVTIGTAGQNARLTFAGSVVSGWR